MTKKIFMVVMMVLFCTASAMATVNEKGKIYIKPVAMLPDGTIVKTSYDEASEELSVEAEEAAGEETSDIWIGSSGKGGMNTHTSASAAE